MLRKLLLPAAALIALGGCATGYDYRSGNGGDYYHGQSQVEYRHVGPYVGVGGYYGGYGGYYGGMRPVAYYDRFGRLVYGYPYGSGYSAYPYYGRPYYGYPYAYPPRVPHPPRPGDNGPAPDPGHDTGRHDRKPPWRDFGRMSGPRQGTTNDAAVAPRTRPLMDGSAGIAPRAVSRPAPAPRMESRRSGSGESMRSEAYARPAMSNEVREVE